MRKLEVILTVSLGAGLLASAGLADEKPAAAKATRAERAQKIREAYDNRGGDKAPLLPVHRRGQLNLQSRGRPSPTPLPRTPELKGESAYTQGWLDGINDGRIVLRYSGKSTDAPNKKTVKYFRLGAPKRIIPLIKRKLGEPVRLELKHDANGQPMVVDILPPVAP